MSLLNNEQFITLVNNLTVDQLVFILNVWRDRLSVFEPESRCCYEVEHVYINGTAIEFKTK